MAEHAAGAAKVLAFRRPWSRAEAGATTAERIEEAIAGLEENELEPVLEIVNRWERRRWMDSREAGQWRRRIERRQSRLQGSDDRLPLGRRHGG